MRKFYYDDGYVFDMGEIDPSTNKLVKMFRSNTFFKMGYVFGLVMKFAAGYGIGIFVKSLWHAFFG